MVSLRGGRNKGLTKETDERVAKNSSRSSEGLKQYFANLSPEEKIKWSEISRRKSPTKGGIRRGSGRGKKGWYNGFWCDSSWELAWVIYSLDHGIIFERNIIPYEYKFEGKTHKFYPDFLLSSGELLEIKGYLDRRNEAKISSVSNLTILGEEEMKPFLEYASDKFGTNFACSAYQLPPEYLCKDCGTSISKGHSRCAKCAGRNSAKFQISWPSCEELARRVSESNWERVAKELGISSNAIRKHLKVWSRSSKVERLVEAQRDGGSSPSETTIVVYQ